MISNDEDGGALVGSSQSRHLAPPLQMPPEFDIVHSLAQIHDVDAVDNQNSYNKDNL